VGSSSIKKIKNVWNKLLSSPSSNQNDKQTNPNLGRLKMTNRVIVALATFILLTPFTSTAFAQCYLATNGNNLCPEHINWLDKVGRNDRVASKNTGDIFCSGDRSYSSNNIPRAQISDAEFQYQWNVHLSDLGFSDPLKAWEARIAYRRWDLKMEKYNLWGSLNLVIDSSWRQKTQNKPSSVASSRYGTDLCRKQKTTPMNPPP